MCHPWPWPHITVLTVTLYTVTLYSVGIVDKAGGGGLRLVLGHTPKVRLQGPDYKGGLIMLI